VRVAFLLRKTLKKILYKSEKQQRGLSLYFDKISNASFDMTQIDIDSIISPLVFYILISGI
tara:strand:- start:26451 stop:26633 length:183 start_codon:yes stop_codon:yes gene_type:complete